MTLSHLTNEPVTDPVSLYRMRDGLYAVDLLTAAIAHLDFFTWLASHPSTPGAISAHFQIHQRPADVMLTLFTAMGLVTQAGGVFHLTLRAREHLVKGSAWDIAPYYASLKERPQTLDMLKVLRTGHPANWGSYDPQAWAQAMERPEFAEEFTAAMNCRGVYLAQALAKKVHLSDYHSVLDIGGGSGIYACTLVAHYPHLHATVFEKQPVDRLCRDAIARQGGAEKISVIAGDMFQDELPTGFDVHLISNVLHDWNENAVRTILAASYRALAPGGLLIIHDAHINAEKTGPLPVAMYSALLMNVTEGKCYSLGEIRTMLNDTGFEWAESQSTAADRSFVSARKSGS